VRNGVEREGSGLDVNNNRAISENKTPLGNYKSVTGRNE